MKFNNRLKLFREKLNIKTKQAMASKLGISRPLYSMLENGSRKPSQDILNKLINLSSMPEEYWLYGITYSKYKDKLDFPCIKKAYIQLKELGLLKDLENISTTEKQVLLLAIKADLKHLE